MRNLKYVNFHFQLIKITFQSLFLTDYDAPLTEAGDYTDKYYAAKDLIARFNRIPNIYMPALPAESVKTIYPEIQTTEHLTLEDLLLQLVTII